MTTPIEPEAPPSETLGKRVAFGAVWIAGSSIVMRFIGLINTLILARLLVPEDFGLIAIGVTVTQLLQNISDIGIAQAVIKFRDAGKKELDTLFTLSFAKGAIVCLLLIALAYPASLFYEDPRVVNIFIAMGGIAFVQSLINPRFYEFQRNLDFSKDFWVNSIEKLSAVILSIAVAVIFRSYWAIIIGIGTGAVIKTFLSYKLQPHRPSFGLAGLSEILSFTGYMTLVSFFSALNNKLDILILGRFVPAYQNGAYYLGLQIANMPSTELATPIASAIYPGLSEQQNDPDAMRRTVWRSAEILAFIALPACFGSALVAHDVIYILLGQQWGHAVPVLQTYAPLMGVYSIYAAVQGYALASGYVKEAFLREAIFFLIRTPIFLYCVINYGMIGAVYGVTVCLAITTILYGVLYAYVSRDNPLLPLMKAWRSLVSVAVMSIYFLFLRDLLFVDGGFLNNTNWPALVRLFVDVLVGGLTYLGMHFFLWRRCGQPDGVEEKLVILIRNKLSNKKPV